jgi:hypothetical protein
MQSIAASKNQKEGISHLARQEGNDNEYQITLLHPYALEMF